VNISDHSVQFKRCRPTALSDLQIPFWICSSFFGAAYFRWLQQKFGGTGNEDGYVTAPQVVLRDRVAAVYNKVGIVANGDRVRVLERSSNKRFVRVRTTDGKEAGLSSDTSSDRMSTTASPN